MSDADQVRVRLAVAGLTSTLGEIYITAAAQNRTRLSQLALTYRDTLAFIEPLLVTWVASTGATQPRAPQMVATMDSVQTLFQASNLRGALQQTHALLSALPGEPDFPPIDVPPVPGDDD